MTSSHPHCRSSSTTTARRRPAPASPVMHEITVLAAFVAGLLGSTHCLGMCGGIATALGTAARPRRPGHAWQALLYNFGRIISYGTAGAIAGALGGAAGLAFAISGWSEILRLATAVIVVVIGLDIALG